MTEGIGHNSKGLASEMILKIIGLLEAIISERSELNGRYQKVMATARKEGLEPQILRLMIEDRRLDSDQRKQRDELIQLYRRTLGLEG